MLKILIRLWQVAFFFQIVTLNAQSFVRSTLAVELEQPWEILYGPDNFLWISDIEGRICRVNPQSGEKATVFRAMDYFDGSDLENLDCGEEIGAATYGLALHPAFMEEASAFVYLFYSYNAGSVTQPKTLFKIVELIWSHDQEVFTNSRDLFTEIPNGYDHWGGRMIALNQNGQNYLYFSVGDHGLQTDNCYPSPTENPNRLTQDPNTMNGKIHRIYIDGTIPEDNPIPGNSFFTRGHRNPQGLAYNDTHDLIYAIEHGHQTDDEINILFPGLNYGWQDVRGYSTDGNHPGEIEYVNNYIPNDRVPNDRLVDPMYAWATTLAPGGGFLDWRTVAPSDGVYYGNLGIPEWQNSLLVVTLKNGTWVDQEVYQFKLDEAGTGLVPSTAESPNPKTFFGEDQELNGRLRDISLSPDGRQIFLITNNWGVTDPIIVYTYQDQTTSTEDQLSILHQIIAAPNPFTDLIHFQFSVRKNGIVQFQIRDIHGKVLDKQRFEVQTGSHKWTWINNIDLPAGIYIYNLTIEKEAFTSLFIVE